MTPTVLGGECQHTWFTGVVLWNWCTWCSNLAHWQWDTGTQTTSVREGDTVGMICCVYQRVRPSNFSYSTRQKERRQQIKSNICFRRSEWCSSRSNFFVQGWRGSRKSPSLVRVISPFWSKMIFDVNSANHIDSRNHVCTMPPSASLIVMFW